MATYLSLFKHTTEAKRNIDQSEAWLESGEALAESMGGEVLAVYYGSIGEYDAAAITEFPDDESAQKVRLAFESEGTHDVEQHRVYDREAYLELLEETPV